MTIIMKQVLLDFMLCDINDDDVVVVAGADVIVIVVVVVLWHNPRQLPRFP